MARIKRNTTDPWRGPPSPHHGNPWVNPPEVTPEMEALADAWDEGGRDLIAEVEKCDVATGLIRAFAELSDLRRRQFEKKE
jgi:hypothetical protein